MTIQDKRLTGILFSVAILLLIPLAASQFINGFNWTGFDYLTMGVLLLGSGLVCEFILRKVSNTTNRIIFCGIALLVFFIIWVELAVGYFGTLLGGS